MDVGQTLHEMGDVCNHGRLRFRAVDESARVEITQLSQSTYENSLDCPELTDAISADTILDGYLRHSEPGSRCWYRIMTDSENAEDVGVLIMHDDEEDAQTELLYLGVVPKFRGRGYGAEIVDFAKSLSFQRGRRQMALAVDTRNEPAMKIYRQAGMAKYVEHDLYARVL